MVPEVKDLKDLERTLGFVCCGSRLRKGEMFAYVGSIQNLKDLKDEEHLLFPQDLTGRGN